MDTIATYLDNMFRHLPRTPEVLRARAELAQMMEDSYREQLATGASENEAIGYVIAHFGDLDELVSTLGLDADAKPSMVDSEFQTSATRGWGAVTSDVLGRATSTSGDQQVRTVEITKEDVDHYLQVHHRATIQIAIGVGCFIFGVATSVLAEWLTNSQESALGLAGQFGMAIVGLALIIPAGISFTQFKDWQGAKLVVPLTQRESLDAGARKASRSLGTLIPAGIAFILVGIVAKVALTQWLGHDDVRADALLLTLAAIGVPFFIVAGMQKARFDRLLNKNEYRPRSPRATRHSRLGDTLAGVFWVLIPLTYLIWSFGWDAWEISWMIWPVAGLVFAAGAIIFQAFNPDHD